MSTENPHGEGERLLTPAEVADLLKVDPKTVTRWARSGKLSAIRTPRGHRRYRDAEVRALLAGDGEPVASETGSSPGPGDPELDL